MQVPAILRGRDAKRLEKRRERARKDAKGKPQGEEGRERAGKARTLVFTHAALIPHNRFHVDVECSPHSQRSPAVRSKGAWAARPLRERARKAARKAEKGLLENIASPSNIAQEGRERARGGARKGARKGTRKGVRNGAKGKPEAIKGAKGRERPAHLVIMYFVYHILSEMT